jgi:hypothetical protein
MQVLRWLQRTNFVCLWSSELIRNNKANMKTTAFWNVTLYSLVKVYRPSFRILECRASKQKAKGGGTMFPWNVGIFLPGYML